MFKNILFLKQNIFENNFDFVLQNTLNCFKNKSEMFKNIFLGNIQSTFDLFPTKLKIFETYSKNSVMKQMKHISETGPPPSCISGPPSPCINGPPSSARLAHASARLAPMRPAAHVLPSATGPSKIVGCDT